MGAAKETAAKLARAVELGAEIEGIKADRGLQKLSPEAWLRMAGELAGGADPAELRELIASQPYLNRVVHGTAQHWLRTSQDRPCTDGIFLNGDGEYAPAYAERIVAKLTAEQCSAVVAVICAEQMPAERWGFLRDFEQPADMVRPFEEELAALDEDLGRTLLLRDVAWEGHRASLRAGEVSVVLDAETASRPATALSRVARDHVGGIRQVAA